MCVFELRSFWGQKFELDLWVGAWRGQREEGTSELIEARLIYSKSLTKSKVNTQRELEVSKNHGVLSVLPHPLSPLYGLDLALLSCLCRRWWCVATRWRWMWLAVWISTSALPRCSSFSSSSETTWWECKRPRAAPRYMSYSTTFTYTTSSEVHKHAFPILPYNFVIAFKITLYYSHKAWPYNIFTPKWLIFCTVDLLPTSWHTYIFKSLQKAVPTMCKNPLGTFSCCTPNYRPSLFLGESNTFKYLLTRGKSVL